MNVRLLRVRSSTFVDRSFVVVRCSSSSCSFGCCSCSCCCRSSPCRWHLHLPVPSRWVPSLVPSHPCATKGCGYGIRDMGCGMREQGWRLAGCGTSGTKGVGSEGKGGGGRPVTTSILPELQPTQQPTHWPWPEPYGPGGTWGIRSGDQGNQGAVAGCWGCWPECGGSANRRGSPSSSGGASSSSGGSS